VRYGVQSEEAAERARIKVLAALDRLEAELDGNEYLVGDSFSVADLTAASLFYPLVLPPQAPDLGDPPDGFQRFRLPLEDRPGYGWVVEMYRRHRVPARARTAVPA
jgi:glutathione S-transferase